MSHIKNVEAFERLTVFCAGCGSKYNPAQEKLRTESMLKLLDKCRQEINNCSVAKTAFNNRVNARAVAYEGLSKWAMRVVGELKSSGVLSQTEDDAQAIVRKLQGYRPHNHLTEVDASTETATTSKVRRARGLDFATMAQHFAELIQLVASQPAYQPEATELSVAELIHKLYELREANTQVINAASSWSVARKERDIALYVGDKCLRAIGNAARQKVKALFGTKSEEYRVVFKIRFRKPKEVG
jgi:hypothetical protein